jgi:hypothetical protein
MFPLVPEKDQFVSECARPQSRCQIVSSPHYGYTAKVSAVFVVATQPHFLPNHLFPRPTETFEWLIPHTNLKQCAQHNREGNFYIVVPVPFCVSAHLERGTLDSSGSRRLQDTHSLGANRLWATVHSNSEVPDSCSRCTVSNYFNFQK